MKTYKSKKVTPGTRKNKKTNKKMYGGVSSDNYIVIQSENGNNENLDELKKNIIEKSFETQDLDEYIRKTILEIRNGIPNTKNKKEWMTCKDDCFKVIRKHIDTELQSTAYILRTLAFSIVSFKDNSDSIQIVYTGDDNGSSLTGKWEKDQTSFRVIVKQTSNTGKLIMGLGPSASGKTYWAKTIIKLLNENLDDFPDTFLSIDGGIYRESSFVYQSVIYILKKLNVSGISNLVSAGIKSAIIGSLFDSNKIKKTIKEFLKNQISPVNLYVPETLGDCLTTDDSCFNKHIKPYVELTRDNNWTALHIYQHVTGEKCEYPEEYKCVGTTESGKSREITEGKKYSSSAYKNSFNSSNHMMNKTEGIRLIIHNSGGKKTNDKFNKSIIINKSLLDPFENIDMVAIGEKYNFVYTNDDKFLLN